VGIPKQWMLAPADHITREAFHAAIERLVGAGVSVETVDEPALAVSEAAALATSAEVFHVHRDRWEQHANRYGRDVASRLRQAAGAGLDSVIDAKVWDAGARHALSRLLARFDVLVTPTVGSSRKVIGKAEMAIDGEHFFHRLVLAQNTWPVNRVGNPALAIPIASSGTPPASMQVIGRTWGEADLLEIGLGLESAGVVGVGAPPITALPSEAS
jgi:Asp-tRNA(Asn)/Glu-tRNA(Gln) amidotransferase A subunit family amidase